MDSAEYSEEISSISKRNPSLDEIFDGRASFDRKLLTFDADQQASMIDIYVTAFSEGTL